MLGSRGGETWADHVPCISYPPARIGLRQAATGESMSLFPLKDLQRPAKAWSTRFKQQSPLGRHRYRLGAQLSSCTFRPSCLRSQVYCICSAAVISRSDSMDYSLRTALRVCGYPLDVCGHTATYSRSCPASGCWGSRGLLHIPNNVSSLVARVEHLCMECLDVVGFLSMRILAYRSHLPRIFQRPPIFPHDSPGLWMCVWGDSSGAKQMVRGMDFTWTYHHRRSLCTMRCAIERRAAVVGYTSGWTCTSPLCWPLSASGVLHPLEGLKYTTMYVIGPARAFLYTRRAGEVNLRGNIIITRRQWVPLGPLCNHVFSLAMGLGSSGCKVL